MAGRRVTLYFSWDKRAESTRQLGRLNNRFPALFEVRRVAWPGLETLQEGAQGVDAFLDRIVLGDFARFLEVVEGETGVRPKVVARGELDGTGHQIDRALADGADTLIVVSLDHAVTQQRPYGDELAVVRSFVRQPGSILVVCPHHWVGGPDEDDDEAATGHTFRRRLAEHAHHADVLVPPVQQIGGYARALLAGLDLPVENVFGLRPATRAEGQPVPLEVTRARDTIGLFGEVGRRTEVTTFNAHPHLPHLQPLGSATRSFHVLARQHIDPDAPPHPFTAAGNATFNALLWAPPASERAGHVLVCDATLWSAAFKGVASLTQFWTNLCHVST
jgi:hypothetical protein